MLKNLPLNTTFIRHNSHTSYEVVDTINQVKSYDDITPALQAILLHFTRGYTRWISLVVPEEKLTGLDQKWTEVYGTRLAAYQRQDKKQKGLPTAVAVAAPVLGQPGKREVILMATEYASTIKIGPFSKEKWSTRLPEFSRFVIVHEPRDRGDYAWTWRIQEKDMGMLEKHLTTLVKSGDGHAVAAEAHHWVKFYPMFGGVRRQVRKALNSARKLWQATHKDKESGWTGPHPEKLPMMVAFRGPKKAQSVEEKTT